MSGLPAQHNQNQSLPKNSLIQQNGTVSQPIASKLPLSNINNSHITTENSTSIHNNLVNNINKSNSSNMSQQKSFKKTNTNDSLLQPNAVRTEVNSNTTLQIGASEINAISNDSNDEKLSTVSTNQTNSTSSISPNDNSSINNGKTSTASDSSITPTNNNGYFSGYLLKWTNYIKGYQKRWFVLNNGLLSYFR